MIIINYYIDKYNIINLFLIFTNSKLNHNILAGLPLPTIYKFSQFFLSLIQFLIKNLYSHYKIINSISFKLIESYAKMESSLYFLDVHC